MPLKPIFASTSPAACISGGTRHADGRRARDTFTGLKKTCRKLAYSFWQYLLSRLLS